MLDWTLYADDNPFHVESKIYSGRGMTWKDPLAVSQKVCIGKDEFPSITNMVSEILNTFSEKHELRVVGLSLGGQIALSAGALVASKFRENLRIVLLEPVFFTLLFNGKPSSKMGYLNGKVIADNGGVTV